MLRDKESLPRIASHVRKILKFERLPALGPGAPERSVQPLLRALTAEQLTSDPPIKPAIHAKGCLAGLWLLFDLLVESHTISQSLETPEGYFWHAIMHRREPDAWNSKYWFRQVGMHPVLDLLQKQALEFGYKVLKITIVAQTFLCVRGRVHRQECLCHQYQNFSIWTSS
jgi:hypothetical protein